MLKMFHFSINSNFFHSMIICHCLLKKRYTYTSLTLCLCKVWLKSIDWFWLSVRLHVKNSIFLLTNLTFNSMGYWKSACVNFIYYISAKFHQNRLIFFSFWCVCILKIVNFSINSIFFWQYDYFSLPLEKAVYLHLIYAIFMQSLIKIDWLVLAFGASAC